MANGVDDQGQTGVDIANLLRQKQLLDAMQQAGPAPDITPQQQPQLPSFITQPQGPSQYQLPTTQPMQGDIAQPPVTQPATITPWEQPAPPPTPPNPYQAQMDEINRRITQMGKAGEELSALKGQAPTPSQYKVSKLRAGLLMPLQILAGAGGRDTSKEYGALIRPGYNKAMQEYQKKVDAAQSTFDTMRETTKAQLEALKDEGVITKDQAEAAYQRAEIDFKNKELAIRQKEAETAAASIPPLNQGLKMAEKEAIADHGAFTVKDFNKEVEDYSTATENARLKAEQTRLDAQKNEREAQDKLKRQESNLQSDIKLEQNRVESQILKPIESGRAAIANLRALRAAGNTDGFINYLSVVMADNALNAATHGQVRQNVRLIQDLIRSPGWLEYLKGLGQGILHPGRGTISDATLNQIDKALDKVDSALDTEEAAGRGTLVDLSKLDPTEPSTRGKLGEIIGRQYIVPKTTPDKPGKPAPSSPLPEDDPDVKEGKKRGYKIN